MNAGDGTWVVVLQFLGVIAAFLAAIVLWFEIKNLKEEFKGGILFNALNSYIAIQKDRRKAVSEKDPELANEYYREMFDLHWTEFNLWRKGYIDDNIMKAWLHARRRNYEHDTISTVDQKGNTVEVSYSAVWDSLVDPQNAYFIEGDPFKEFMNDAHNNNIQQAIDRKKDKERF